jgi:hypothetical protein
VCDGDGGHFTDRVRGDKAECARAMDMCACMGSHSPARHGTSPHDTTRDHNCIKSSQVKCSNGAVGTTGRGGVVVLT